MVWGAAHALGDKAVYPGVRPGTGHDFVEQVGADAARTGIGKQHAAGLQNLEGQAVDVFVSPGRALGVRHGGRVLGRVEHDGVKGLASLGKLAQ